MKGLKEYTKNGYLTASKHFNPNDLDVSVAGRSFMITGANSGLGKSAAVEIAKRGGTVHIVCRNKERGEAAQQEIKETANNENIHLHQLDMSSPKDIIQFAKTFQESGEPLNVLINNAGCMVNTRELTAEGYEKNFATNTLGTYILTVSLLPILSQSKDPRVIIVSSGGMLVQKLDVKDLQLERMRPFDGTMAYAQNKRQQVIMAEELGEKYPNVKFSSMHPGWADTPAVRSSMPEFYEKMKDKLRTVEQGADTIVWLAISDAALKEAQGKFFQDRKSVPTHLPLAWTRCSKEDRASLMTTLEEHTEKAKF